MVKRYEVVVIAEKDSKYGHCETCKHYQKLNTCSNCSNGSRYCFDWKQYYENNKEKFNSK